MKVSFNYPPNYDQIKVAFNLEGVTPVFTYGDTIYNPHKGSIDSFLLAHEEIHSKQQGDNPKEWWDMYVKDTAFRGSQEISAYQAQYKEAKKVIRDRNLLFKLLVTLARDLSSEMYGKPMTFNEAMTAIKKDKLFVFDTGNML